MGLYLNNAPQEHNIPHPDDAINVPILKDLLDTFGNGLSYTKAQRINIVTIMVEFFMNNVNWISYHPKLKNQVISKLPEFINDARNENAGFIQLCNNLLVALGQPEYHYN